MQFNDGVHFHGSPSAVKVIMTTNARDKDKVTGDDLCEFDLLLLLLPAPCYYTCCEDDDDSTPTSSLHPLHAIDATVATDAIDAIDTSDTSDSLLLVHEYHAMHTVDTTVSRIMYHCIYVPVEDDRLRRRAVRRKLRENDKNEELEKTDSNQNVYESF